MNKNLFGKYPQVEATYGKTFGVIPPGLIGNAKIAAEKIVNNAIADFHAITEGSGVTDQALLPVVATMVVAQSSKFHLLNGWT